ncbi:hypothetical protein [Azospirillum rugosum]|uniref:Uncharacterized protein n=1 Tax=Azospirillum rugosum TaxID=416170 RepID=A0ABS4SQ61_9PROT|nr:hypothetical protein [Azospirillum rugosum]MBP2294707.1 hypothetical protein [Azospirillum rugosum]MDQ0528004.1 hypothetical protein [Azospirillum rugosum]
MTCIHGGFAVLEMLRAEAAWHASVRDDCALRDSAERLRVELEESGFRNDALFFQWTEAWRLVKEFEPITEAAHRRYLEAIRAVPQGVDPFAAAALVYGVGTA